ncbi:hypothetical protein CP8484711_0063, partial [Chlamydia psittaci 84-8471/1]
MESILITPRLAAFSIERIRVSVVVEGQISF